MLYSFAHNLCKSHGDAYEHEWDVPAAAEPVVELEQGVEEAGRNVREGLMSYLNS